MKKIFYVVFLIVVVSLAFWLALIARDNVGIQEIVAGYGYPGIIFVSFISGLNLIVPIPAVSFIPLFVESGLNFWIAILLMVIGMTAADMIAFYLGKAGRYFMKEGRENRMFIYLERLRSRYKFAPFIFLFLYAALIPFPNEVVVLPMGFLGYKARNLLVPLLLGNSAFNILSAFGILGAFNALL
jgi:membrane protein YqaA with SNARE-associated domain